MSDECRCGHAPLTRTDGERLARDVLAAVHAEIENLSREYKTSLRALSRKIDKIGSTMASQADIDALAALVHQEDSDLNAAVAGIQSEIQALQAQVDAGQPVDLSALSNEVANLRGAVDSAAALVPAPAAPPVDGGDGSTPVDPGDGSAPSAGGDVPAA